MKTLYLLRHAKSSWKDDGIEDFDRPLNKRGRAAAAAMGAHLARREVIPAQVLCSSAKRTRETWAHLQAAFGSAAVPVRFEKGIYLAEPVALLRRLRRLDDSLASAMLIGHNPGLELLAVSLSADGDEDLRRQLASKFPTGTLAVLEAVIDRWADLRPGSCRLTEFVRARDLPNA
jgi:phosphohistidine phosphatase